MKNHSHFKLWLTVIIMFTLIIVMFFLFSMRLRPEISDSLYVGLIGSFMAICSAIMLATQIYAVFNRTQIEKEYDEKLDSIKKWYDESVENQKKELDRIYKATRNFNVFKYHVNDALGGVHCSENKQLAGIIDVIENLHTMVSNEEIFREYFQDEYDEKIGVVPYFIAQNLKRYTSDKMIADMDRKGMSRLQIRWNKRYRQILDINASIEPIKSKMEDLHRIFNDLINGKINEGSRYCMRDEDVRILDRIAQ